jgi:histidinol phosphatase-like PHP family hydrolase
MIDLHTHTFFSDGALVPAEHLRRVEVLGYEAVAVTDHADSSNLDFIIPRIVRAAEELNPYFATRLLPGIELTHVPPALIADLTKRARDLGALVVVVHGETPVEPVAPGTNRAAIEAKVDVLSHPGFVTIEEMISAHDNGVMIELSGRKGHSLTNGHIASLGRQAGVQFVVNADAHEPEDFLTAGMAEKVALGAGLSQDEYSTVRQNMSNFVKGL